MAARLIVAALALMIVVGVASRPPRLLTQAACASGTLDCGSVTVFENLATRSGRTLEIHYAVARADTRGAKQAVFVFAGGPGEGSTDLAGAANGWLRPLRATRDIVFVDQRGAGQSHPLTCTLYRPDDPAASLAHVFDPAAVAACRKALERDADLGHYTTDEAVSDVEAVRATLGYEHVSLYGASYGTRMAQAYMRRYPGRVSAAVIDGVVPFDNVVPLTYAASAQRAIALVWAQCAETPACHTAHPHPDQDFATLLHRLDQGPGTAKVSIASAAMSVPMSRGAFGYAVRGMLYRPGISTTLADMIGRALASGDFGEFADAYLARERAFDRSIAYGQHFSVFCAEDVAFPEDDEIGPATAGTFLGRYLFDEYRAACRLWPRGAIAADFRTPVTVRVPTLLVSGALDPVTPPAFADRVGRSLPMAQAVVDPNGSHGSATSCPRAAVLYVLEHGALSGVPAVCR